MTIQFDFNRANLIPIHDEENPLAISIDDMFLPRAYFGIGEKLVLETIKSQLDHPQFDVKFKIEDIDELFLSGHYGALFLPEHHLTVKTSQAKLLEGYFKVVESSNELVTFEVYLDEGPFANTIKDAIWSINGVLGPKIKKLMSELGIVDYQITFNIFAFY